LLKEFGSIYTYLQCPCANSGYSFKKNISSMTAYKYREGESTRLMVAKETLKSK